MRSQQSIESLIMLAFVLLIAIILMAETMNIYQQFDEIKTTVNNYYRFVFSSLLR